MMYASERIGPNGFVLGVDRQPLQIKLQPNMFFIKDDIIGVDLKSLIRDKPFDVVLSDLAPATTGIKHVDQARSLELASAAFEICRNVLIQGGVFMVKVFEGPDLDEFFWIPNPDQETYPDKSDFLEYYKFYDFSADGAYKAHEQIKVGGPAIAGDIQCYIKWWFPHCLSETNYGGRDRFLL